MGTGTLGDAVFELIGIFICFALVMRMSGYALHKSYIVWQSLSRRRQEARLAAAQAKLEANEAWLKARTSGLEVVRAIHNEEFAAFKDVVIGDKNVAS